MNDEDFSDEEEQLYKTLDDVVTFFDKDGLNEYPYIYDEAYVYQQTKIIYQKLNDFYSNRRTK